MGYVLLFYQLIIMILLPFYHKILGHKLSSERGFLLILMLVVVAPFYSYIIRHEYYAWLTPLLIAHGLSIVLTLTKPKITWLGISLIPIIAMWIIFLLCCNFY